jgi:hypothetical protein
MCTKVSFGTGVPDPVLKEVNINDLVEAHDLQIEHSLKIIFIVVLRILLSWIRIELLPPPP